MILTAWARVTGSLGAKVPFSKPEIHPWDTALTMNGVAQKFSPTSGKGFSPSCRVLNAMAMVTNSARVIFLSGPKVPFS